MLDDLSVPVVENPFLTCSDNLWGEEQYVKASALVGTSSDGQAKVIVDSDAFRALCPFKWAANTTRNQSHRSRRLADASEVYTLRCPYHSEEKKLNSFSLSNKIVGNPISRAPALAELLWEEMTLCIGLEYIFVYGMTSLTR